MKRTESSRSTTQSIDRQQLIENHIRKLQRAIGNRFSIHLDNLGNIKITELELLSDQRSYRKIAVAENASPELAAELICSEVGNTSAIIKRIKKYEKIKKLEKKI